MNNRNAPIGVFDSGVGGLTVLQALRQRLPEESFIYLGDTARLPYGTKSKQTVVHYATQAARILLEQGIKMLVVACNTASALALPELQQEFAGIPVVGVVEPGAKAACAATQSGQIIVIATESTVNHCAYQNAIKKLNPEAIVHASSCSLFVALAEEGWLEGPIAEAVARRYLEPLFAEAKESDCLVLGCTHFPALLPTFRKILQDQIIIVDSAQTTATAVAEILDCQQLNCPSDHNPALQLLATDSPQRFAKVAAQFLNHPIVPQQVQLVELKSNHP